MMRESDDTAQRIVGEFNAVTRSMQASMQTMQEERHAVQGDVEQVLVSLQFQDRINQIIEHVTADMARFDEISQSIARDGFEAIDMPSLEDWQAQLAQSYTMLDQHAVHRGETPSAKHKAAAASAPAITFF